MNYNHCMVLTDAMQIKARPISLNVVGRTRVSAPVLDMPVVGIFVDVRVDAAADVLTKPKTPSDKSTT